MKTEKTITLIEIQNQLKHRKLYQVAAETKLNYITLQRIRDRIGNPSHNTVLVVSKYLMNNPSCPTCGR
mgnify:FL=1